MSTMRYPMPRLVAYAQSLLEAGGCDADPAASVAELLVVADAMGHDTHGLAQLPGYLDELANGGMSGRGEPEVVADRGAVVTWDGKTLPGVWLTARAVALGVDRARQYGQCAIAIRRSHHIACLATFLPIATEAGMMAMIASSDPADASVAPFGGTRAVFTPDPIAIGIPTGGDPILIDISASITTNGMTGRLRREGRSFPGLWAIDAMGLPSNDPNITATTPPGTLLPVGGLDHGHKGYGLALLVEALSQGLPGFGRSMGPAGWGAGVFVQVYDPAAFGGLDAFKREMDFIAEACRSNPPRDAEKPVRLPGQLGLAKLRAAQADGVALYPGIIDRLGEWGTRLGVKFEG